jgi:formylglycine-generating enzyme required for sulfatase activity
VSTPVALQLPKDRFVTPLDFCETSGAATVRTDRFVRQKLIIFPVARAADAKIEGPGSGTCEQHVAELFQVAFPMKRFDNIVSPVGAPSELTGKETVALSALEGPLRAQSPFVAYSIRCTDWVAVPVLRSCTGELKTVKEKSGREVKSYDAKVEMQMVIWRRQGDELRHHRTISADAPTIANRASDIAQAAQAELVRAAKKSGGKITGKLFDTLVTLADPLKAVELVSLISPIPENTCLASGAKRPKEDQGCQVSINNRVLPFAQPLVEIRKCLLDPPDNPDDSWIIQCGIRNRAEQVAFNLQKEARGVEGWRLWAAVKDVDGGSPGMALGKDEGVYVGEVFHSVERQTDGSRVKHGFAKVMKVGPGGDGGDCNATNCGGGCCDGSTCVAPPTLSKCGAGGAACSVCSETAADSCGADATCRCGSGPVCAAGRVCKGGQCRCGNAEACGKQGDQCVDGVCKCGSGDACAGAADTCVTGECRCGSDALCSGGTDRCTDGRCRCGEGEPCSGTTDQCVKGSCLCGSSQPCAGTADRCDSGTCRCGAGAACERAADTCAGGACRCGSGPACSGTADSCAGGMCQCGNGPACLFPKSCVNGICASCATAADCNDNLACTDDQCQQGVCANSLKAGFCFIGGVCVAQGIASPTDPCQVCNPTKSTTSWSSGEGQSCDDGKPCTWGDKCAAGVCQGTAYTCDDGIACTDDVCLGNGSCTSNVKPGYCFVGGQCVTTGTPSPTNPCQACDPTKSTSAWSNADGKSCDDGKPCTWGDKCSAGACQGTAYTCTDALTCTTDSCTGSGPAPGGCTFVIMTGTCLIGGVCYPEGAANPLNPLQHCVTSISTTSWTGAAPGTWVTIPSGTFSMGSPATEPCRGSNETQHSVTLTHSFEITTTEVTQAQFQLVMGYNPSVGNCGSTCPVNMVSWSEAAAHCNMLSTQTSLGQCYACSGSGTSVSCQVAPAYNGSPTIYACPGYRLPTEAEWEYAYRAGTTGPYYIGSNDASACTSCSIPDANADLIGWYCYNSLYVIRPVAQKKANAWGLFDMAGNTEEWVHDWYQNDLGSAAQTDPWGPATGSFRMTRGGSVEKHLQGPNLLRAASRSDFFGPTGSQRYMFWGFRCVRSL